MARLVVALSLLAYSWPALSAPIVSPEMDPFRSSPLCLPTLIAVTMFAIGRMLPRDEVNVVFARWPMVLAGITVQYMTMPLLAFLMGGCGAWRETP